MAEYIDAEKLIAEIQRRNLSNYHIDTYDYETELYEIIDSLRKEQIETNIDLETEIKSWIPNHVKGGDYEPYKNMKRVVIKWAECVARYFYELGLNARKENKI